MTPAQLNALSVAGASSQKALVSISPNEKANWAFHLGNQNIYQAFDRIMREMMGELQREMNRSLPAVTSPKPNSSMSEAKALQVLTTNLSRIADPKTGTISPNDLMRAAQGQLRDGAAITPKQLAEIKNSAQFYLKHPGKFNMLETADGRLHGDKGKATSDGAVTADDLASKKELMDQRAKSNQMTDAKALKALTANLSFIADPKTGTISPDDLKRAAQGKLPEGVTVPPERLAEIKSAAQFYLDRPHRFKMLETADGRLHGDKTKATPDGVVTVGDLASKKVLRDRLARPDQAAPVNENQALENLTANLSYIADPKTGAFTANDLMRAAQGQLPEGVSVPQEKLAQIKSAAQFYLDNPGKFNMLETADGRLHGDTGMAKPDGVVTLGDLAAKKELLARHAQRGDAAPLNENTIQTLLTDELRAQLAQQNNLQPV